MPGSPATRLEGFDGHDATYKSERIEKALCRVLLAETASIGGNRAT